MIAGETCSGVLNLDVAFRDTDGTRIPVSDKALMPTRFPPLGAIVSTANWSAPTNANAQFLKLWGRQVIESKHLTDHIGGRK